MRWSKSFILIFFFTLVFYSCKSSQSAISSNIFYNKKYSVISLANIEDFIKQDTIYLFLSNPKRNTELTMHFQDRIVRINEKSKEKIVSEKNEKGVLGTTQYYANQSYYGEFQFVQEENQIKIYNLYKYVYDNVIDTVKLEPKLESDTLLYYVIAPSFTELQLVRIK